MRGIDGERFDARVPLGRHFRVSLYKGFFPPHGYHGKRGVDGKRFSRGLPHPATLGVAAHANDGGGAILLAHIAHTGGQERASTPRS
jgi:hypothetical protein